MPLQIHVESDGGEALEILPFREHVDAQKLTDPP